MQPYVTCYHSALIECHSPSDVPSLLMKVKSNELSTLGRGSAASVTPAIWKPLWRKGKQVWEDAGVPYLNSRTGMRGQERRGWEATQRAR